MESMIAVVEYGVGNVGSILNMLKKIGANAVLTGDKNILKNADKIILPGVGSFDFGMEKLKESGLLELVIDHAKIKEKPLLGICLGMQMLGNSSEEGTKPGLGLIDMETKKFKFNEASLKIPHMGWNYSEILDINDPLMEGINKESRYYFVHSFHAVCSKKENELMVCDYGYKFPSVVKNGKIYGVQFHPEKSHRFGMKILENFVNKVR